jgi:hypothetical protein
MPLLNPIVGKPLNNGETLYSASSIYIAACHRPCNMLQPSKGWASASTDRHCANYYIYFISPSGCAFANDAFGSGRGWPTPCCCWPIPFCCWPTPCCCWPIHCCCWPMNCCCRLPVSADAASDRQHTRPSVDEQFVVLQIWRGPPTGRLQVAAAAASGGTPCQQSSSPEQKRNA